MSCQSQTPQMDEASERFTRLQLPEGREALCRICNDYITAEDRACYHPNCTASFHSDCLTLDIHTCQEILGDEYEYPCPFCYGATYRTQKDKRIIALTREANHLLDDMVARVDTELGQFGADNSMLWIMAVRGCEKYVRECRRAIKREDLAPDAAIALLKERVDLRVALILHMVRSLSLEQKEEIRMRVAQQVALWRQAGYEVDVAVEDSEV